jgi:hypothetical protein
LASPPPPRKTGRPPLREGEASCSLHVRLPTSDFDRVFVKASRDRLSMSEFVRHAVTRVLADDDDTDR